MTLEQKQILHDIIELNGDCDRKRLILDGTCIHRCPLRNWCLRAYLRTPILDIYPIKKKLALDLLCRFEIDQMLEEKHER